MSDLCPVDRCDRPRHHDQSICGQHSWELKRNLAELPALADALDTFLARQRGQGVSRLGGTGDEQPLPYDLAASDAITLLRATLVGWVRDLQPDPTLHPRDNLGSIGRWLYAAHHNLVIHAAAEQAVDEIGYACRVSWRAVDLAPRTRVDLDDPCPDCGAQLRAVLHDVGDPRPNVVWCLGESAHRWEPQQWLRLGQRLGKGA